MTDAVESTTVSNDITSLVRAQVAAVLHCSVAEVDLTARVTELPGMDSAKLVEVVVWCERHWQIELDEETLFDVRTCQDLCELVAEVVAAKRSGR